MEGPSLAHSLMPVTGFYNDLQTSIQCFTTFLTTFYNDLPMINNIYNLLQSFLKIKNENHEPDSCPKPFRSQRTTAKHCSAGRSNIMKDRKALARIFHSRFGEHGPDRCSAGFQPDCEADVRLSPISKLQRDIKPQTSNR